MPNLNTAPISLEEAKKLVTLIENGDHYAARELLAGADNQTSVELFTEVGKLTRQLHNSLHNFQLDPRIKSLTNEDIPDAQTRLSYVVEATEDAANRTMDLVDTCMPIAENLQAGIVKIMPEWNKLISKKIHFGEFNLLVKELDSLLKNSNQDTAKLSGLLTEILMAQGYQDLTGQIIGRVIELVKEIEDNLVNMLTMFGGLEKTTNSETGEKANKSANKADMVKAEGPILDADSRDDVASDQDDVDDLLSSMGF